jgi:hypothetical protein
MAGITASQFRRQLRLSVILQALLQFWVKSANAELLSFFEMSWPSLQGWQRTDAWGPHSGFSNRSS